MEPGKKERRYVRHINFIAPDEENIQVKLVYDYRKWHQLVCEPVLL